MPLSFDLNPSRKIDNVVIKRNTISDTEYLSNVVLSCQGFRDEAVESKQSCEAANTSVTNMKTEITNMYNEVKTLSCFKVQDGLLCVAVEV